MAILALRSNNLHDISAAIRRGGWTNNCSSSKVKVGDTVVVFGNQKVCREAGVVFEDQMVLVGILNKKPYRLDENDENWPSSITGTRVKYVVRFDLDSMDLVPFSMFRQVIDSIPPSHHLQGGLYLE